MTQDEIVEMARHISKVLGSRMCDENGDTHGEELYCMAFDDIVDAIKLVADIATAKEREKWSEVKEYLIASRDGSMSRNNSEALASELLDAIQARGEA